MIKELKCPNCGGTFRFIDDTTLECDSCGAVRYIVESDEIKKAKIKHDTEINKQTLDYNYNIQKLNTKDKQHQREHIKQLMPVFMALVLIILMILGFVSLDKMHEKEIAGKIEMTCSSDDLKGDNYSDVVELFTSLGFENIETRKDTKHFYLGNNNVYKVLVNGDDSSFEKGDYILRDAKITVIYFSKDKSD